eukprot:gene3437-3709_t
MTPSILGPLTTQDKFKTANSPAQLEQNQIFEKGFDLPLAIALAAAAFEAYLEPSGADQQLIETLLNETHVTYTDRDYVQETFSGLLQLTVHSARGLKAVNITGGSDPYVVATLGDSVGTTEVKWGELEPVWEQTFTLYVPRKEKQILRLRMIDKNKLLSDVDMGTVMVPISTLTEKPGQKVTLQLRGSNNAQGTLTISAHFLPFEDELLAAAVVEEKQVETAVEEVVKPAAKQAAQAIKTIASSDSSAGEASANKKLAQEKGKALQEVVESAKVTAVQGLTEAIDQVGVQLAGSGLVQQAAAVQKSKDVVVKKVVSAADSISQFVQVVDDVFRPVAYIENQQTDTQVWVSVSRELREVVVAFRGTEQVKWKDFVSDINLIPQTLDVERTGGVDLGIGTIPLPFVEFKKNKELMVHSGFLSAYDSIKPKVLKLVDTLTSDATKERPWQIFVTGHSLGGALATLCAYDLAGRRSVTMYTYGAPRVGNKAFAGAFNERLQGRSWRITNTSDIVPSVPRLMGYAHVSTGVRLNATGKLKFEKKTKDVLGEGREVAEVITDLASQALEVAQGTKPMEEVVDTIRDHEMKILNALIDGSALGQHMEDFYLATLKEAVLAADPALCAVCAMLDRVVMLE